VGEVGGFWKPLLFNDLRSRKKYFEPSRHDLCMKGRTIPIVPPRAKECVMLVLTRKLQQQIKIGEEVTVTILRVKGNSVRVGIQAPRSLRVARAELPKNPSEETGAESPDSEIAASSDLSATGTETSALDAAATQPPSPPPSAGCLPLRQLRQRRGIAPLKQVMASCGVLAK
jgi:carbon storage regulator CsrA